MRTYGESTPPLKSPLEGKRILAAYCRPMLDATLEKRIREEINDWGSLSEAARVLGVSPQYLSQVLGEKCPASDKLLAALGLERRIHKIPKNRIKQGKRNGQV